MYLGRLDFPWPQLYILACLSLFVFIFFEHRGCQSGREIKYKIALGFTYIANATPIISLFTALVTFTIYNGHPTVQLSASISAWENWLWFWLFTLLMHGISFLLLVISYIILFKRKAHPKFFIHRAFSLLTLCLSFYCTVLNMPDA